MKLKHRQAFVLGILYRLECIQLMRAADVALFVFCIHITDEYAEYTVHIVAHSHFVTVVNVLILISDILVLYSEFKKKGYKVFLVN